MAMCLELATQKGWRRYDFSVLHFIHCCDIVSQTERYSQVLWLIVKANLVLYQSCKYELPNILNGDRAIW